MSNYIILSEKEWHRDLPKKMEEKITGSNWFLIDSKEEFNTVSLAKIKPVSIFIPHWSHLIPEEIYSNYECIVFHMTDLPFGRGGSPLQNLIVRGLNETKISALRVEQGIDTGPVYLKSQLSLDGTAREIFLRAASVIEKMIQKIICDQLQPEPQKGEPVIFKRRKKEDGNIKNLESISEIYNYIRMLDADGYPKAYLEFGDFVLEFSGASIESEHSILADVRIIKK
nr:methionyl-tRNA formyltransferase [uncultured Fluviicola sp.]